MRVDDLPAEVWAKAPHLLEPLRGIDLPEPTGWFVLCVQWKKPDTVRGVIMPSAVTREDEYQGRSGVVIAIGPLAYKGEKYQDKPWVQVGDWVAWPAMENAASRMKYEKVVVTALPDDRIVLRGVDPEKVS